MARDHDLARHKRADGVRRGVPVAQPANEGSEIRYRPEIYVVQIGPYQADQFARERLRNLALKFAVAQGQFRSIDGYVVAHCLTKRPRCLFSGYRHPGYGAEVSLVCSGVYARNLGTHTLPEHFVGLDSQVGSE